jgi:23S rRNA pseudouridine1911/1915/1917 synthase
MVRWPERMDGILNIIHEDGDLLAVNKPAGLVCHPTKGDELSSLISRARLQVGELVKLHMVNRLDRETSGVCLFVKGDQAAKEIRQLFESREIDKAYQAIVRGWPAADQGLIDAPIDRDSESEVGIKRAVNRKGAPALTEYAVGDRFERPEGRFARLNLRPRTGRTHQIRVHLAHLGHPLVGDKIYGGDEKLYLDFINRRLSDEQRRALLLPGHALHAGRLRMYWRDAEFEFSAEPEEWFAEFADGLPSSTDWAERFV